MTIPSNSTSESEKKPFDKRLLIVFLILFTEVLGFSMVLPVIPFLALTLGLSPLWIGFILSIFSFCQLFASPITGKLSDRYGRRPLFILSQISTLIGFILLGFANSVWLLVVSRIIDGLLGSNMTVSQAYITDISEPEERTKVYGYSSAVFGAGLIFGPLIGGTLSTISFSTPMFFASGITVVSIILIIFFLPETIHEKPAKFSIKFSEIFPIDEIRKYRHMPKVSRSLSLFFIYNFGFMLFISNFALFTEIQFQASALIVGYFQSWIGVLRVILQSFFIATLIRKIGENASLRIGVISMIIAMIGLILSPNFLIVFLPLVFVAIGTGLSRPILTSRLTTSVPKNESGTVLGVNSSLSSIGQIISPLLGGLLLETLPAIIVPGLSGLLFCSMFLLWRVNNSRPLESINP